MVRIAMAMLLLVVCVSNADAWPRRSRSNRSSGTTAIFTGGPQAVAEAKAARSAAQRVKGHLGGGFGGGNAEGVGFSTSSAQHALNSCCFTGQRRVAGSAVVRGSDGWYAVKIYY